MKKKLIMAVMLVLSAVLLVAASVLGTMAFLASSTAVSNTFTYGDVGIHMLESKVDENGVDLDGADRTVDGNSYKLIPNKNYVKDPAIFVKEGSVPSFLFVKVKNGISTIEKEGDTTMKSQMVKNGWQIVKSNDSGEELYLYVGVTKDSEGNVTGTNAKMTLEEVGGKVEKMAVGSNDAEMYEIFSSFTIKEEAAVADYAGAKVTLTAFAIQTEGFNDVAGGLYDYQNAWNAIVGRFPFESGTAYVSE